MFMKRVMRFLFGLGLLAAAIGFALPLIDLGLFGGKFNGFQLANLMGKVPQICLYVLFGLFCVGGVVAFIPKANGFDILFFLLIIVDIGGMIYSLTGGKTSGNSIIWDLFGDSIKDLVLNIMQPGAWVLIIGFIVAIIAFILRPFAKGKK